MEKGQWLYFVDVNLGKITTHLILEYHVAGEGWNKNFDTIKITGSKYTIMVGDLENSLDMLNPNKEEYMMGRRTFNFRNATTKKYLVFTDKKLAQEALVDYVLPSILIKKQKVADEIIKDYQSLIKSVEETEKKLEIQKKKLAKM